MFSPQRRRGRKGDAEKITYNYLRLLCDLCVSAVNALSLTMDLSAPCTIKDFSRYPSVHGSDE